MAQLRSVSSGTDVLSMSARSTRATLPHAAAPPAYISIAEAENLVYAEIEQVVKISNSALQLLNGFLDQILYDILSKSQSISLTAVRAAIPLVLKQRLGRAAVKAGDDELQDYLEEYELEEIQHTAPVLDPKSEFDVELAWKLARLRCMVYAKLGDMEEEDEEDYLEGDDVREHLNQLRDANKVVDRMLPPTAIFLTTVLEFIGEQGLCIAAQHARKRHAHLNDIAQTPPIGRTDITILLEEIDMSGIGKEGPLIRLWRSWKGSVRSGSTNYSRPTTPNILSPTSPESPTQEWRFPTAPAIPPIKEESRSVTPANIPLPATGKDVEEIEAPEGGTTAKAEGKIRRPTVGKRNSTNMLIMPGQYPDSKATNESAERPQMSRRRSRSVPTSPVLSSSTPLDLQRRAAGPVGTASSTEQRSPNGNTQQHNGEASSGLRSTAIGATVATIAGALSVEAAKVFRRDHSTDSGSPVSPESVVDPHSSHNTANDFERMHIPLRAQTAVIDAAEREMQEAASEAEDPALGSSADEGTDVGTERVNPRDSGFGVAGAQDEMPQHIDGANAGYEPSTINDTRNDEVGAQGDAFAPSTRSSNVGYATIFQTSDMNAGYSSSNSTRNSGPEMTRPEESIAAMRAGTTAGGPVTSAWPAVIPNRRSSLEHREAEQTDAHLANHFTPSQFHQQGMEQPVPRFATSAYARSRSASATQARPSTSGSSTARRQHLRLRSEDTEARPREDLDRAKKSLDLLIDSDETLHYTLTPASATVGGKLKARSQTQALADFFRETAPPEHEVRPKSSRSNKGSLNGLRANPPTPVTVKAPSSQPPVSSPSRPKKLVGEPREARMVRNNTRDLADYARSTGPENEAQLPKSLGPRPSTAQGSKTDFSLREKALAEDNRPDTAKTANRLKYQARDAKVPRTADSSDLIDFIREGPPRAPGEHRIDRHVAPFRTTMDSDDLNALAPPPELDARPRNSEASVPESAITAKSMPSSLNSRTGLLDSTNRVASKPMNGVSAVSKQPAIPEADGMPKRTRRRVRDPYAIDYSDEEDEVEQFEAPPRRTDEESLVDFLRNTAPPPGMATLPILAAVPGPTQPDASNMLKRSASGSKLRDFLPGGASANKNIGEANGSGATPASRPVNIARASSPHLTQAGSKLDKYKPTTPTHAAHVDRNRTQGKARVEPRGALGISDSDSTADLAAFLKDSRPPPGMNEKPVQKFNTSLQRDQAGFMKFFQRRGSVRK
ncbi:hypothetical protein A1O7_04302 [Cladophialophora yegresii CBS 114405]|uniref:Uncharacterized protein n=1 Tax=Cladophialophora yegresii CBS 114405 TaxID=1182544 RepID=W9W576_9EURO|nr:uncharacterized protein A1O7_04302 [Cladophialophora yegresii CBS 114405]EXJ60150.1 hypothetical protein A1O7_04302 [Cladophialophora yegresii CBS 114405]